jgi:hypothetical protein
MASNSTKIDNKRKKATEQILTIMDELDSTGNNRKVWEYRLKQMSDSEFKNMMKEFAHNTRQIHLTVDINPSSNTNQIDLDNVEKIANKYGIKLTEYVFLPHENPTDPSKPYVTATPVPIIMVYVRKMGNQMLEKKNSISGDIDVVNPITGQVTGESKSASLSDTQTSALTTTNQLETIKEFLTIRADNLPGKMKMMQQIEKYGTVNFKDCDVQIKDNQSLITFETFLRGALLISDTTEHDTIDQNKKIIKSTN